MKGTSIAILSAIYMSSEMSQNLPAVPAVPAVLGKSLQKKTKNLPPLPIILIVNLNLFKVKYVYH
jgi:hypothetical protein